MNENTDDKHYVPGAFYCAKCKAKARQVKYNTEHDKLSLSPSSTPLRCINGCGPMWKVTWEMHAIECEQYALKLFGHTDKLLNMLIDLAKIVDLAGIPDDPFYASRIEKIQEEAEKLQEEIRRNE